MNLETKFPLRLLGTQMLVLLANDMSRIPVLTNSTALAYVTLF